MNLQDVIKKYNLHPSRREDWAAPYIQSPSALREYIEAIGFIGATIKKVSIAGYGVGRLDNTFVAFLYPDHSVKEIKDGHHVYYDWDYDSTMEWVQKASFQIRMQVDEPIVFETDRENFEMDFSESSTIYLSRNLLPKDACHHVTYDSFDISKLLASLNGTKIDGYDIEEYKDYSDADFDFTNSYSVGLPEEQDSYIKSFCLNMSNGQHLKFYNDFDYGWIELLDQNRQLVEIHGLDINQYLMSPIGTPRPYDD